MAPPGGDSSGGPVGELWLGAGRPVTPLSFGVLPGIRLLAHGTAGLDIRIGLLSVTLSPEPPF